MKIQLENFGKKYVREWIFKGVNFTFEEGGKYAITGGNGSGKTTFLKTLSGAVPYSKGKLSYKDGEEVLPEDKIWQHVCLTGPYVDLIEEFSLKEILSFSNQFKPLSKSLEEIEDLLGFVNTQHKLVRDFSSGMKQKLKLALAFFSEGEVLFLDEPTSNLDHQNIDWYQQRILEVPEHKLLLIASNQPYEYEICQEIISMENFKN